MTQPRDERGRFRPRAVPAADAWWASLSPARRAQVFRWLTERSSVAMPDQEPLPLEVVMLEHRDSRCTVDVCVCGERERQGR